MDWGMKLHPGLSLLIMPHNSLHACPYDAVCYICFPKDEASGVTVPVRCHVRRRAVAEGARGV